MAEAAFANGFAFASKGPGPVCPSGRKINVKDDPLFVTILAIKKFRGL